MARLKALNPESVSGKTKDLFNIVEKNLGVVPNMMRTMGNSPAFLEGYLNLGAALGKGTLNAKTGELIALAVAQSNSCDYCLSAHTYLGLNLVKADAATLEAARSGNSTDAKTDAILKFSKTLVNKKGLVSDSDVNALKVAGIKDGEVGEIIGHVALNILTNYFNNTAGTEIDFPVVEANESVTI